jgi:hypothetical protein
MSLFTIRYVIRILRTMRGEDTSSHDVIADLTLGDRR